MAKEFLSTTQIKISNINQASNSRSFNYSVLADPQNLSASFALRYEVYCRERQFLVSANYPQQLETDSFDTHAIHVGGVNCDGVMVGTVRLVLHSMLGLPLFGHCDIFPEYKHLAELQAQKTAAEVSRLAITRHYQNLLKVTAYEQVNEPDDLVNESGERRESLRVPGISTIRQCKPDIILGIYKTIYQVSKRKGITHWFAAMEKSLVRLMRRFHFAFTPIGPELDYYGPVTPYVVAISDIEAALYRYCPTTYADFINGLEPEFVPAFA